MCYVIFEHIYEQSFAEEGVKSGSLEFCYLPLPMNVFPSAANHQSPVQRSIDLSCVPGQWNQPLASHCFLLCFNDASGSIQYVGMQHPKLATAMFYGCQQWWYQYWYTWRSWGQVCNPRIHATNFSYTGAGFSSAQSKAQRALTQESLGSV